MCNPINYTPKSFRQNKVKKSNLQKKKARFFKHIRFWANDCSEIKNKAVHGVETQMMEEIGWKMHKQDNVKEGASSGCGK